jgi:hypothetical protein
MYGNMVGRSDAELHLSLPPRNLGEVALDDSFRPSWHFGAIRELSSTPSPNTSALSLCRPVSARPTRIRCLSVVYHLHGIGQ